jgi:signal transduction histidine kinase
MRQTVASLKRRVLNKIVERVGHLDSAAVRQYLSRLARQQGALELVFDALRDGVIILDAGGRIQFSNAAAERLLGVDADAEPGVSLAKYVRGLDWAAWVGPGASVSREVEVSYPEQRVLQVHVLTLTPEQDDELAYALILHDVTESREAVREAAESERVQTVMRLAASVAHEVGNPLNAMGLHLQLLEREVRRLPERQAKRMLEPVAVARAEVERLDGIVKQFLQAMRPAAPRLVLGSVNDVVAESLALFAREVADRDLLLETQLAADVPAVLLDAAQMKQVFYNLLKNAIQAMAPGGILQVSTYAASGGVVIAFRDNGGGIPPERMSQLFEPYHSTKSGGTGLGLFIVRRIVREHGGDLEIESEPGRGTEVRVRLPFPGGRVKLLES